MVCEISKQGHLYRPLMFFSPDGPATTLLVEILSPLCLASCFNLSFSLILSLKAVLHLDTLRCSILTFIFFWDDSISNSFINDNSSTVLIQVENSTSLSVIE